MDISRLHRTDLPIGFDLAPAAPAESAAPTAPTGRVAAKPVAAAPRRNAPGPAFGSAEFNRLLDSQTGSVRRPNNKVQMLFDGVSSFAERKRMIQGAKESICLQTFIFTDDDTGWDTARDLVDAAKRGVKVRVIFDGIGSNRADSLAGSSGDVFEFMRKGGVEVREYADPVKQFWDLNNRWHEKHLIVDGKASVEGGMNIADEYAFGGSGRLALRRPKQSQTPWRDADMKIEGPAVGDTTAAFLKNWKELGSPVPRAEGLRMIQQASAAGVKGGPNVRVVQHRPDEDGDQHTNKLYLAAIRSAEKSITIENAYFNPPENLRRELIAAAKRGVEVKIMTNSVATNDTKAVSEASHYFYPEMLKAGIKIYERQTSTLHSKTASFDGKFSLVGSANLNGRSDGLDSESVLATEDPATAKALDQRFTSGLKETKPYTMADHDKQSFWGKVKSWGLSLLSDIF